MSFHQYINAIRYGTRIFKVDKLNWPWSLFIYSVVSCSLLTSQSERETKKLARENWAYSVSLQEEIDELKRDNKKLVLNLFQDKT